MDGLCTWTGLNVRSGTADVTQRLKQVVAGVMASRSYVPCLPLSVLVVGHHKTIRMQTRS